MMKKILALLSVIPLFALAQNQVGVTKSIPMRQAVSGHYAGWIGNELWTWGGCNFPDKPCADGGEKKFYPQAYGASVQIGNGVLFLGGQCGPSSLTTCEFYPNSSNREMCTPLPVGLDNFGATYYDGTVYVAGGQSFGKPNRVIYCARWEKPLRWVALDTLPDNCRLQPCVQVQYASAGPALYVFGGYQPQVDSIGQKAIVHNDGVYMNLATHQWNRTSPASVWIQEQSSKGADVDATRSTLERQAIVGAASTTSGYSHVLFFGGVNYDVFYRAISGQQDSLYLRHQPQWYKFRQDVLVYHTITDSWALFEGDSLLARAGACLTKDPDNPVWYYSGGETMPGIRSADVSEVRITTQHNFGWLNWTVLVLYLVAMLGMGVYFMRKENGADDFFKGGGRIPWWAAGISIYATMLSAITYMAIPAKAYTTDWTYYPMLWMIPIVGLPVIKYYLPYFRKLKVASAYEILEERFNPATRLMSSALFCIFMVARMALVMYLPSLALTAVTGIDIYLCIILMGLVTIIYCTMGGVEAVIWGDVVQGIILVGGAIFAAAYLMTNTAGGISSCIDIALDNDKLRLFDWSNGWSNATWWVVIIGGLANNLISYTSDQTVIQRYMTTKDEKSASQSIMVNGFMSVFISVAFYMIGTGLYTFYKTHPAELDVTMSQSDAIFPFFMMSQMPAGIAGLLIAAIFAATMSTISSNINSVSTAFSVDFVQRFRPSITSQQLLKTARWTCIISGLIGLVVALMMATWNIQSLLDYFNTILGLLTSGLGGLFFVAVFMPRVKGYAALTGFIAGEVVVFWMSYCTDANLFLFGATGIIVCVIVSYILSFITKK